MFYVYMITNKINNKKYIGKTSDINERWLKHLSTVRTGIDSYVIHNAIKKYGLENFEIQEIDSDLSEKNVLDKEVLWIAYYKTNISKYGNEFGYNLTDGGEGLSGFHHSDEVKAKISQSSKGKPKSESHKQALRQAKLGTKLSEEHKKNIGLASLGKVHTEEAKKKLSNGKLGDKNPQAILTPEIVLEIKQIYRDSPGASSQELSKKYGVAPRTIRDIKNNKTWKHI